MDSILRSGLLDGATVALAGADRLRDALTALGADVHHIPLDHTSLDEPPLPRDRTSLRYTPESPGSAYGLVVDLRDEPSARAALDAAWTVVRQAGEHKIPKIVLIAPANKEASRRAIENLARTTSIEWARNQTRTAAVLPATSSPDAVIADLTAWLMSPAGDYFSGAALTLTA